MTVFNEVQVAGQVCSASRARADVPLSGRFTMRTWELRPLRVGGLPRRPPGGGVWHGRSATATGTGSHCQPGEWQPPPRLVFGISAANSAFAPMCQRAPGVRRTAAARRGDALAFIELGSSPWPPAGAASLPRAMIAGCFMRRPRAGRSKPELRSCNSRGLPSMSLSESWSHILAEKH